MLSHKTFYINSDQQWVTNSSGYKLRVNPVFHTNSNYFITFYITDNNSTPIDLTGYEFKCGIDYQLGANHVDIALSDNDQFNRTGTSYELSAGYINCRLYCDDSAFPLYMEDDVQNVGYFSLWGKSPTNQKILFTQTKVELKNPIALPSTLKVGGIGYMTIGSTFIVDTVS